MKIRTAALTLVLALGTLVSEIAFADVFVIAHLGVQLTANDVREIFLGEKQFVGSTKLTPIDNGPVQEEFLSKVLRMEPDRYSSVWTKKSFREGLNPPSVRSGDAEVIDFVRKTPGAVGYVSTSPGGVSLVQKY